MKKADMDTGIPHTSGMSNEDKKLTMKDPGWTEYVLSKMTDNEKYNGNPKVAGLRRMVELLLGNISYMNTDIKTDVIKTVYSKQSNTEINETFYNTLAKHTFRVNNGDGYIEYCGSADSSVRNTEANFMRFGTAIAETRAKGRAYINALALQCVSSEELNENPADQPSIFVEKIKDAQISAIDIICKKTNINVMRLFGESIVNYGVARVTELSENDAKDIIKRLNGFQQNTSSIPANLVGYKPTWRNAMGVKDE